MAGYDVSNNTVKIGMVQSYLCVCVQSQGPHLFQTCPSSNYYDCKAMAIGARSQSARTYLEKKLDDFADCETATYSAG